MFENEKECVTKTITLSKLNCSCILDWGKKRCREKLRLRVASERYVDLYRGLAERLYDGYETNNFLPPDIIPNKGTLNFPLPDTECTRYHRKFPREEFSFTQLKNGEQKCRVCKEVKRLDDVAENRYNNWMRNQEEEDYVYYSDDGDFGF